MKLNISHPSNGSQKLIDIEDERKLRVFMEKRVCSNRRDKNIPIPQPLTDFCCSPDLHRESPILYRISKAIGREL